MFADERQRISVRVRSTVSVNSFTLLRELAIAGFGVARLPRFVAAPALAARFVGSWATREAEIDALIGALTGQAGVSA